MNQGTIGSMKDLGITESYKLKRQVVLSASEAAEMILRCVSSVAVVRKFTHLVTSGWMTFCARRHAGGKLYNRLIKLLIRYYSYADGPNENEGHIHQYLQAVYSSTIF